MRFFQIPEARRRTTKGAEKHAPRRASPRRGKQTTKGIEKNSLVNNINKRKRAGTSRPKSRSHVSDEAHDEMEHGWPHSAQKAAARRAPMAKRKSG